VMTAIAGIRVKTGPVSYSGRAPHLIWLVNFFQASTGRTSLAAAGFFESRIAHAPPTCATSTQSFWPVLWLDLRQ
jgi:hypothetical protein